jgi:hypothetical protein
MSAFGDQAAATVVVCRPHDDVRRTGEDHLIAAGAPIFFDRALAADRTDIVVIPVRSRLDDLH